MRGSREKKAVTGLSCCGSRNDKNAVGWKQSQTIHEWDPTEKITVIAQHPPILGAIIPGKVEEHR
jgi:hypothetical protein